MKNIIGWVLFAVGALITFVCFGAAIYIFFLSFSSEESGGVQAIAFVCGVAGIPFYFLAQAGWRLNHPKLEKSEIAKLEKPRYDPTEKIVETIEAINEKALFFTSNRVIIADVYESAPGWSFPLLIFSPGSSTSGRKTRRLKKLPPGEILRDEMFNFAIAYSGIKSVRFFKKYMFRKIRIIADNSAITSESGNWRKKGRLVDNNYQFEFWLYRPWRWKKYADTLRLVLPDKVEVG